MGECTFSTAQYFYSKPMKPTAMNTYFNTFRRDRALLTWVTKTCLDLACTANRASQVCEKSYFVANIRELNKGVKLAQNRMTKELKFVSPDQESIHPCVYSDASFANKNYLSSHLGYIVILTDKHKCCHILLF